MVWQKQNTSPLSNIEEIRSIPRGFGSYGDMVLILMTDQRLK